MWIKFTILVFISLINFILAVVILLNNKNKDKSKLYFSLMSFSAGFWSLTSAFTQIISSTELYLWIDRLIYVSTTFIIIFFFYFSAEFPYRALKIKPMLKYLLLLISLVIIIMILFSNLIYGAYKYNSVFYQLENKQLNLIYGIYFIIIFLISFLFLFYKYFTLTGINKKNIRYIIYSTLLPFSFAILFAWYFPYQGKHYLYWIAPIFTVLMNLFIADLLFKKINE